MVDKKIVKDGEFEVGSLDVNLTDDVIYWQLTSLSSFSPNYITWLSYCELI